MSHPQGPNRGPLPGPLPGPQPARPAAQAPRPAPPQPPGGFGTPPYAPPPGPAPPPVNPAGAAPAPYVVPAPRKKRGSLRFLAGFLVFNAWLTLVSGVVMAGMTVLSGAATSAIIGAIPTAPSMPSPMPGGMGGGGLSDLGIGMGAPGGSGSPLPVPNPADDLKKTLASTLAVLQFGGAVLILLTGVILCICQLGLSQACYVLLDLEEQNARIQESLQMVAARQGGR